MIYPVNNIAIIQQGGSSFKVHHRGKALDFGWATSHHQWILAVDDGTILKIEKQKNGGNVIFLKHKTGLISVYGHLEGIIVKKNQKVVKGEHIAHMGVSGKCSGEHLHYELHSKKSNMWGNSDLDPLKYLQVGKEQKVLNSSTNKRLKDKILYAPENENFEVARSYRLLVEKALHSTPEITNNILKVREVKNKKNLTNPKKPNAEAYYKLGTDVFVNKLIEEKNSRLWGKIDNYYIVLRNQDGTQQCEKLKGIN